MTEPPFFLTRGVVLVTRDIATLDWPTRAKAAGLTTIATHIFPPEIVDFLATDPGQRFLQQCRELGLNVEHERHAMYAARGMRHVTQFATGLDGCYVERFGEPPVAEHGTGLQHAAPRNVTTRECCA